MKKLALTGILLALTAGASYGAGLNLAWDACLGQAGATVDKNVPCATTTTAQSMYGSFVLGSDFPGQPTSVDNTIDVLVAGATMPTFWNSATGAGFGARYTAVTQAPGCALWYDPAAETADNAHFRSTSGQRVRIKVTWILANPGLAVPAGQHTSAFGLNVNMSDAPANAAGCETPVCFLFSNSLIEDAFGGESVTLNTPDVRNHVTWKGGGVNCPAATPTTKKTWGQIKAIYR